MHSQLLRTRTCLHIQRTISRRRLCVLRPHSWSWCGCQPKISKSPAEDSAPKYRSNSPSHRVCRRIARHTLYIHESSEYCYLCAQSSSDPTPAGEVLSPESAPRREFVPWLAWPSTPTGMCLSNKVWSKSMSTPCVRLGAVRFDPGFALQASRVASGRT